MVLLAKIVRFFQNPFFDKIQFSQKDLTLKKRHCYVLSHKGLVQQNHIISDMGQLSRFWRLKHLIRIFQKFGKKVTRQLGLIYSSSTWNFGAQNNRKVLQDQVSVFSSKIVLWKKRKLLLSTSPILQRNLPGIWINFKTFGLCSFEIPMKKKREQKRPFPTTRISYLYCSVEIITAAKGSQNRSFTEELIFATSFWQFFSLNGGKFNSGTRPISISYYWFRQRHNWTSWPKQQQILNQIELHSKRIDYTKSWKMELNWIDLNSNLKLINLLQYFSVLRPLRHNNVNGYTIDWCNEWHTH